MQSGNYLALAAALFVAMIIPGPGVIAVVGRALAVGWRRNLSFIGGMVLGDVTMLAFALSGMAAIALSFGQWLVFVKIAGGLYLLWAGYRAWTAPAAAIACAPDNVPGGSRAFLGGWTITVSNPKVMLFYAAVLPALVDLPHVSVQEAVLITMLIAALLFAVMLGYSLACAAARRLLTRPGTTRALNRGAGCLLMGAGVAVAAS